VTIWFTADQHYHHFNMNDYAPVSWEKIKPIIKIKEEEEIIC